MRRALRLTIVLGVALFTFVACFSKPDAPHFQAPNDGGIDAKIFMDAKVFMDAPDAKVFMDAPDAKVFMDAPPSTCGAVSDDFNTVNAANPCGTWGTLGGAGTFNGTHSGSVLTLTGSGSPSYATCTSQSFKLDNGTSIQVVTPAMGGGPSKTWFALNLFTPSTQFVFSITQNFSTWDLNLTCPGTSPVAPTNTTVAPTWIRFVTTNTMANHLPGMVTVKVQMSADGSAAVPVWNDFRQCVVLNQADGSGFVEMGGSAGSSQSATATFDNFNIYPCPPP